ncbi:MAG: metallophosphoesterase, partial [Coraliomargarita sp.]|nr:metallophosphoesterase [Coraliomargarita sp.]
MKLLVVPDIHEDLVFLQSILSEEDLDSFDHVVLLGDYFDPRGILNPDLDNLRRVAETLLSVKQQLGERLHMLCGNHDLPYYALRPVCRVGSGKPNTVIAQWLESTTLERAEIINDVWDDLFWRNLKGAVLLDGWLFSHAGIHPDYWPKGLSGPLDAYERFQQHWRDAMATLFG